jgi:hypothetical protein
MKQFKRQYLLLAVFLIAYQAVYAQSQESISEQERVRDFFIKNTPWETTKDSTMVYAFAFKASVKKDKKGNVHFISLTATDTLAYQIFPKYKFLETVNYKLYMKGKSQATFIFPIVIEKIVYRPLEYYDNRILMAYFIENHFRENFSKKILSLFSTEHSEIENNIYFPPVSLVLDTHLLY